MEDAPYFIKSWEPGQGYSEVYVHFTRSGGPSNVEMREIAIYYKTFPASYKIDPTIVKALERLSESSPSLNIEVLTYYKYLENEGHSVFVSSKSDENEEEKVIGLDEAVAFLEHVESLLRDNASIIVKKIREEQRQ